MHRYYYHFLQGFFFPPQNNGVTMARSSTGRQRRGNRRFRLGVFRSVTERPSQNSHRFLSARADNNDNEEFEDNAEASTPPVSNRSVTRVYCPSSPPSNATVAPLRNGSSRVLQASVPERNESTTPTIVDLTGCDDDQESSNKKPPPRDGQTSSVRLPPEQGRTPPTDTGRTVLSTVTPVGANSFSSRVASVLDRNATARSEEPISRVASVPARNNALEASSSEEDMCYYSRRSEKKRKTANRITRQVGRTPSRCGSAKHYSDEEGRNS